MQVVSSHGRFWKVFKQQSQLLSKINQIPWHFPFEHSANSLAHLETHPCWQLAAARAGSKSVAIFGISQEVFRCLETGKQNLSIWVKFNMIQWWHQLWLLQELSLRKSSWSNASLGGGFNWCRKYWSTFSKVARKKNMSKKNGMKPPCSLHIEKSLPKTYPHSVEVPDISAFSRESRGYPNIRISNFQLRYLPFF